MSLIRRIHLSKLELSVKNADALILGGPAAEGGDIKVHRDGSGNLQLSVDADAASNGEALVVYGGVVCQNYLTIGQSTLYASTALYVNGNSFGTGYLRSGSLYVNHPVNTFGALDNTSEVMINIPVNSGSADHTLKIQIDSNDIIAIKATGDGAGGVTNPAIGLYPGTTPTTQAAAISDPAESIAGNNAAIDSILAALRGIGLIAT